MLNLAKSILPFQRLKCIFLIGILACFGAFSSRAQTLEQKQNLLEIYESANERFLIDQNEVRHLAELYNIPLETVDSEGRVSKLVKFRNGYPVYIFTTNAGGAELINSDKVYTGGTAGLELSGSGQTLGIWDSGRVRAEHQEFTGRVTQMDGANNNSSHATHVAGTMMAEGVEPNAKGMSNEALLHAYDWDNDNAEMAAAAADGLRVSQHSYGFITGWASGDWSGESGWHWFGNPNISEEEDYLWGFYNSNSQIWDEIAHNAPHYLIVKSAGNDRGRGPSPGTEHYVFVPGNGWELSSQVREKDGGDDGFDVISHKGLSKNIMTVGAVTNAGNMSGFSAWGPTDDGRIKPDIVAKGVSVYSTTSANNSSYGNSSGTSMSGPMISGSIGLLLEHQENLHPGVTLLSSTIKGIILHTADNEISGNPGPDYKFGWGLMDTEKAADVMSRSSIGDAAFIHENTLFNSDEFTLDFEATGEESIRVTLVWTDVPGNPVAPALNPTDLMLVNDLDMRMEDQNNEVFFPYILNPDNPNDPATTGDNFRDNVEMIYIESPDSGMIYTLNINHKGNLTGGSQEFSLILTGANITGLASYDIGISAINHPPEFICDSTFEAELLIYNFGEQSIDSFWVHYELNSTIADSIQWFGSIGPFQATVFSLPVLQAEPGLNELLVYTSRPNGEEDENNSNDSLFYEFNRASKELFVMIVLDNYPGETSWNVVNDQDEVIASGGPYGGLSPGDTILESFCVLQDNCYTFTIFDTWGDGICCDWGDGSYMVIDVQTQEIYASGGEFGFEESTDFCINEVLEVEVTDIQHIPCGEINSGSARAIATGGTNSFSYEWSDGQTSSLALNLSGGLHYVTVDDGNVQVVESVFIQGGHPPNAYCSDLAIFLDSNGEIELDPIWVDAGSVDSCGIESLYLSNSLFYCDDVGENYIWLFVVNEAGQLDSCQSLIEVQDTLSPTALCQDIIVQLDSNGVASIVPGDIDNGSFDNCDQPAL
ncbi:MAG: hypothetical protein EA409_00845, partial [Saprospirales bacterium]